MTTLNRRSIALAVSLSALAGFVDAMGFLTTKGFFISFMSGNSTRLGVAVGKNNIENMFIAGGVIGCFVGGVILGTLIASKSKNRKRARVLLTVSILLAIATFAWTFKIPHVGLVAMVMAMGAENAVFQQKGETNIGLTYMTGALVKCGQRIAAIFEGAPKREWAPYALLWAGLVCGAAFGTWAHSVYGTNGLVFAIVWSLLLALITSRDWSSNGVLEPEKS